MRYFRCVLQPILVECHISMDFFFISTDPFRAQFSRELLLNNPGLDFEEDVNFSQAIFFEVSVHVKIYHLETNVLENSEHIQPLLLKQCD